MSRTSEESLRRVLTSGFSARDLAEPLVSFDASNEAAVIRELMRSKGYQTVGVRDEGKIVGLVHIDDLNSGSCQDHLRAASPEELIADDAGLAEVVQGLVQWSRLYVTLLGSIYGILTRTDLEKPPMRMWLFGMITTIEQRLGQMVELRFAGNSWQEKLSPQRVEKAAELWNERQRRGISGTLLDCLQLTDKGQILVRDSDSRNQLGFQSRRQAEQRLKGIEALRNNLAHSQEIVEGGWETVVMLAGNLERVINGPPAVAPE